MAQNLETQFMADLPDIRLAPFTPPFHHTACDYFGPIVVKVGRNKTAKHYGALLNLFLIGSLYSLYFRSDKSLFYTYSLGPV